MYLSFPKGIFALLIIMTPRLAIFASISLGLVGLGAGSDCGCSAMSRGSFDDESVKEVSPSSSSCASGLTASDSSSLLPHPNTLDTQGLSTLSELDVAFDDEAHVPSGWFVMGTDSPAIAVDGEGPARPVWLPSYYIDKFEVSDPFPTVRWHDVYPCLLFMNSFEFSGGTS